MNLSQLKYLFAILVVTGLLSACNRPVDTLTIETETPIGRIKIDTIPFRHDLFIRSGTYTPSGNILVSYATDLKYERNQFELAVQDDDGQNFTPVFSGHIPERPRANGIRFMIFADNTRIFLGDYVLECTPNLDNCEQSTLVPVEYPEPIADGDQIHARWSEIIIAPDNRHIAWTTLLVNFSALVFSGELAREDSHYRIIKPRIISTLEPFRPDPDNPGMYIPNVLRGGEVKQFIKGGTAISLVGKGKATSANSVVQDLDSEKLEQITSTPGYTETTIFSPDEQLGVTMSSRFSPQTDMAILGLLPQPYSSNLEMGLTMFHYTHAVTGVRMARPGNVGPVLLDIAQSRSQPDYQGINLNTDKDWVFVSPLSWHPDGKKAMWIEMRRGTRERRLQRVTLLDYQPAEPVATEQTPDDIPYAIEDLSIIEKSLETRTDSEFKIAGHYSGHILFSRKSDGSFSGVTEKLYVNYSDDGENFYEGGERFVMSPTTLSTFTSRVQLTGPGPGKTDLKITFGPLHARLPAEIMFGMDDFGKPQSYGYSEFNGQRLTVEALLP